MSDRIEKAKEWAQDAIRTIILPTDDLNDLETQWNDFNSMIKKNRRESDWKSIELFGMTNQERYEEIKNNLLSRDIDNEIEGHIYPIDGNDEPLDESYIDLNPADSYYNPDAINYTSKDVEKAKEWAKESNRTIIVPTRTLEELESIWDAYNLMIKKHRRESDWVSLDLFGLTNLKHYEYLKAQFLREDIDRNKEYDYMIENSTVKDIKGYVNSICLTESVSDIADTMLKLVRPNKTIYEELIINNIISDAIERYNGFDNIRNTANSTCGDMPYMSPEEMIDMGVFGQSPIDNYYGSIADNILINEDITVKEWFDMYKAEDDGFITEMRYLSSDWVNKLRELTFGLKKMIESKADENTINARKQSILELGWNPDIEFSDKARKVAKESFINRSISKSHNTKIIDLREFDANPIDNLSILESSNKKLNPVFVVMTEGKSRFSGIIKTITHSIYSHASISFDYTLEKMYSYAIKGDTNGFREENIKNTPITSKIGVYVFFVSDEVYKKIVDMVEMFKNNKDKTKYSYKNLITYLFNIPYNNDWKMVCSQFVDRCLKVAGIDISGIDSSLVSPAELDKDLKNEKRIYHVYEGLWTKYKPSKIKNVVDSLMYKAKPLKENNYDDLSEESFINAMSKNSSNLTGLYELEGLDNNLSSIYKKIVEEVVFDSIDIKPYCENIECDKSNTTNTSLPYVSKLIKEFIKPI